MPEKMEPRGLLSNGGPMGIICYAIDPMAEPLDTSELVAFARTVKARSFSRAAAELGVPRPTIGRRLARLEERLGVRLLRRTTRTIALTDAGEAFAARAHRARSAGSRGSQPFEGPIPSCAEPCA